MRDLQNMRAKAYTYEKRKQYNKKNQRSVGARYEQVAGKYLEEQGYQIRSIIITVDRARLILLPEMGNIWYSVR